MKASCQCGRLTAGITGQPDPMVVLCHCIDCQKRSGSPFGVIAYYPETGVTLSGEAREFIRNTDAGNTFTGGFCPICGSTVYVKASKYSRVLGITVGAIADPSFTQPARSVYEQSRHSWVTLPQDMPRHPQGRDS